MTADMLDVEIRWNSGNHRLGRYTFCSECLRRMTGARKYKAWRSGNSFLYAHVRCPRRTAIFKDDDAPAPRKTSKTGRDGLLGPRGLVLMGYFDASYTRTYLLSNGWVVERTEWMDHWSTRESDSYASKSVGASARTLGLARWRATRKFLRRVVEPLVAGSPDGLALLETAYKDSPECNWLPWRVLADWLAERGDDELAEVLPPA